MSRKDTQQGRARAASHSEDEEQGHYLLINPFGTAMLTGQGLSLSNTRPTDGPVESMGQHYMVRVYESGTIGIRAATNQRLWITVNCHGLDETHINVVDEFRLRINGNWLMTNHHLSQNYSQNDFEPQKATFVITLTDSEMIRRMDVRHELRSWATLLLVHGQLITAAVHGDELCGSLQNLIERAYERGRSNRFSARQPNYDFGLAIGVTPRDVRREREAEKRKEEQKTERKANEQTEKEAAERQSQEDGQDRRRNRRSVSRQRGHSRTPRAPSRTPIQSARQAPEQAEGIAKSTNKATGAIPKTQRCTPSETENNRENYAGFVPEGKRHTTYYSYPVASTSGQQLKNRSKDEVSTKIPVSAQEEPGALRYYLMNSVARQSGNEQETQRTRPSPDWSDMFTDLPETPTVSRLERNWPPAKYEELPPRKLLSKLEKRYNAPVVTKAERESGAETDKESIPDDRKR